MTRILIVDSNGLGLPALGPGFAAVLQKLSGSITYSLCAPYLGQALPDEVFDGVVFTGSAVAWCVDAPEGQALRDIWRQVTRWQVPIWGSCNGMQLAAFMLGGICAASPRGDEEGLAEAITLTDIGREHPMMQGRASQFRVPCVHRDEVQRLPNGAVLLAGNAHSPVQAFAYETADISFWGTQYHPEFSRADVATWLADRGKSLPDSEEQDGQGDLALATRTLELQNWLAHVTSRQRTTGAK
ncbi:type 1 glutamine amidotransferase [Planktomarina temperata]|nr:type 1 glutamine amidotransferase [Planktomarina temperata]